MWLKEKLKQKFSNDKEISIERCKASKFIFIISSILFFQNFYFVWANFYLDIFSKTLWYMYVILVLSLISYIYFFIKKSLVSKVPNYIFIVFIILFILLFLLLLLPITLDWGLNWLLDLSEKFIKLYL